MIINMILFLDPPFSDQLFINNLRLIKNTKIYEKDYIVIIHREKNYWKFWRIFNTILVKKYGRSKIIFGIFTKQFFRNSFSSTAGWLKGLI